MRLKDRVAIITGGGTGIGRATALAFSSEGASVVVAARNLPNLEDVARQIESKGGKAMPVKTDVADEEQVRRMVERAIGEYGRIDILVNNSGIVGPIANVADLELEDWNQTMAINLTGAMLCSREVLKDMIPRQSGNIINMSSLNGKQGMVSRSAYVSSKWAMNGFTQTLSMEVGKYNIWVNAIAPGTVEGERARNALKEMARVRGLPVDEIARQQASRASLERFVTPEEVAWTAVFLASDESAGITGQVISVDAGRTSL